MNTRDQANQLLSHLAAELPPEIFANSPAEFDNDNQFYLTLDENLAFIFYLDEDNRAVIINVPIASLPESGAVRDEIMIELLHANYGWSLTEGGTLSVDAGTNLICLGYLVALPLEVPEQMPQIVSKLAAVAQHWQRTLAEMTADDSGEADTSMAGMMRA